MDKITYVLQFYAEPKNWQSPSTGFALQYDPEPSPINKDGGKLAKELLEAIPKGWHLAWVPDSEDPWRE